MQNRIKQHDILVGSMAGLQGLGELPKIQWAIPPGSLKDLVLVPAGTLYKILNIHYS